jgi:hypothetical protein
MCDTMKPNAHSHGARDGERKFGTSSCTGGTCMDAASQITIFLVGMALLVAILALGMR